MALNYNSPNAAHQCSFLFLAISEKFAIETSSRKVHKVTRHVVRIVRPFSENRKPEGHRRCSSSVCKYKSLYNLCFISSACTKNRLLNGHGKQVTKDSVQNPNTSGGIADVDFGCHQVADNVKAQSDTRMPLIVCLPTIMSWR